MRLTVTGRAHELTRQWAAALEGVTVRHPNRAITLLLKLEDAAEPMLFFDLDANPSSDADEVISPFQIINVKLACFPGIRAARAWLAAAWGMFLQHEGLELVTIGDNRTRALDPHASQAWLEHTFHTGFPRTLTPDSLLAALATAIPRADAMALIEESLR